MELSQFKVSGIPATVYYIPKFITPTEESNILKNVYSVPKPKWTCLSNRRLQDYGGIPHEKGMIPERIPDWLRIYMNKVEDLKIYAENKPNQVLINEYSPGQGIMPHSDGPLFYPTIATISCGSQTVLVFQENKESRKEICRLLLERCSLVIIKDDLYCNFLHSIEETECDNIRKCANLAFCENYEEIMNRGTRVSLTIRNVPKVRKIKLF